MHAGTPYIVYASFSDTLNCVIKFDEIYQINSPLTFSCLLSTLVHVTLIL